MPRATTIGRFVSIPRGDPYVRARLVVRQPVHFSFRQLKVPFRIDCETSSESGYVESNKSDKNPEHPARAILMGKFE